MPHHESALMREFSIVTLLAHTSMLPVRLRPLMTVPSLLMFVTVPLPSPPGPGDVTLDIVCAAGTPVSAQSGHVSDPAANTTAELAHDPEDGPVLEEGAGSDEGTGLVGDGGPEEGAGLEGCVEPDGATWDGVQRGRGHRDPAGDGPELGQWPLPWRWPSSSCTAFASATSATAGSASGLEATWPDRADTWMAA
jgi:hypothetical protein